MQYCNKSLLKNNIEILQYYNKINGIALGSNALACITPNAWIR